MKPVCDRILGISPACEQARRIRRSAAAGCLAGIAAVVAGVLFLTTPRTVALEGTGRWIGEQQRQEIEVIPEAGALSRIPLGRPIAMELLLSESQPIRASAAILDIDPQGELLRCSVAGIPQGLRPYGRFRVRLILFEGSFWRLLWSER